MNKHYLLMLLMVAILPTAYGQSTTHYGESSGTEGIRGSYFGRAAGMSLTGPITSEDSRTDNTFVGDQCGSFTIRSGNTAVGSAALNANTTGTDNVAIGFRSIYLNTTGRANTAVGGTSLGSLTTGNFNVAIGAGSLAGLTTGSSNSALGSGGLNNLTTGSQNTAVGDGAAYNTTTGIFNTAVGNLALNENVAGPGNTALGWGSGPSNGFIGLANSTAIGFGAKTSASNQVRLGNANVLSIGGRVGWSTLSDGRFKKDIKEDVAGLEFINQLRPVSYVMDNQALNKFTGTSEVEGMPVATNQARESGFIAQEVEALVKKSSFVFHGIEAPQSGSDHYSIRYADFVMPLVKAVQELTAQLKGQQAEISALKQQLAAQSTEKNLSAAWTSSGNMLSQNVPNPFSYDTEIHISLPESAKTASVIIYNLEGKQLKSIPVQAFGEVSVKIQGSDLKPGIYLYSLMVDGALVDSKRMVMMGN